MGGGAGGFKCEHRRKHSCAFEMLTSSPEHNKKKSIKLVKHITKT